MKEHHKDKKERVSLIIDGTEYKTYLPEENRKKPPWEKKNEDVPAAFIPGTITRVYVKVGQKVRKGDKLVILEAMKMKNRVLAPLDGVVTEVLVKEGEQVSRGQALVFLERKDEE